MVTSAPDHAPHMLMISNVYTSKSYIMPALHTYASPEAASDCVGDFVGRWDLTCAKHISLMITQRDGSGAKIKFGIHDIHTVLR